MNLDDFMAELRSHPEYFQVIAQDGGPPSIVMSDPRTDQQVAQYSVPDVTGYRYSDGFQAQMPSGEGDRISVANPDKRPTVQQLQEMWSRSQLPGSGVSFDQYMRETGAKVDASGRVDQTISKDWGFGGGSIWDAIVDLAPKALALYGGVTGLESLIAGAGASGAGGAGALGDLATGVDSLAEANGLQVGNYADLGGTLTAPTAGAATGALSSVPITVEATGALADAAGGQTFPALDGEGGMIPGNYTDLGGTLTPAATTGAAGALGDAATGVDSVADANGLTPTTYGEAGGTMTPLEVSLRSMLGSLPAGLQKLLGGGTGAGGAGGIDWGKLLAGGAGVVGSMYATDKYDKLARDAMDMMGGDTLKNARKGALTRYEANAASPSAFLEDPWVKSALDYSTEARNRALSRTMPTAGNPAAETEIQKSAISSLFGNLMLPYRQQLANEAGIASAPAQAAQLATSIGGKAIDSSMAGWNSAGYGLSGVTGSGSSGGAGNSTNILDLISGIGNLSKAFGT